MISDSSSLCISAHVHRDVLVNLWFSYNLYATLGVGQLAGRRIGMVVIHRLADKTFADPSQDPTSFPLYTFGKNLLQNPSFLKQGGIIGFYCNYDYAHATKSAIKYLPWCLKGLDMMFYEAFKALGCTVLLRPVFDPAEDQSYFDYLDYDEDEDDEEDEDRNEVEDRGSRANTWGPQTKVIGNELLPMQFEMWQQEDGYKKVRVRFPDSFNAKMAACY